MAKERIYKMTLEQREHRARVIWLNRVHEVELLLGKQIIPDEKRLPAWDKKKRKSPTKKAKD